MNYDDITNEALGKLFRALPCHYMESVDGQKLLAAFTFAEEAHRGATRDSGIPYITHPLAVATILAGELRLSDVNLLCAAMLHDVVEDTRFTNEDIRARFGDDVARLVAAVTKPAGSKDQPDDYKHILESVKGDIRVLVLKISDRLHNVRTLSSLSLARQYKISSETLYFFAPLAGRLGLYPIKSELENLAFRYLNQEAYDTLDRALEADRARTQAGVTAFIDECRRMLGEEFGDAVSFDVRYRRPYSVFRDMEEKGGCDFRNIPFKHYIRILFNPEAVGRRTGKALLEMDIALKIYAALVGRFKEQCGGFVNYVSLPKENNYRAIHCRVLGNHGTVEEIHISSVRWREQATYGCLVESREAWISRLAEMLNELGQEPETLMPGIRDTLYNEGIVAFTPAGDPVNLPTGATALDFAYGVHTDLGNHMKYARIGGKLASRKTVLQRGDSVEIFTDPDVRPRADWMDKAISFKARKHIRRNLILADNPKYELCDCCRPLPESREIIGFRCGDGHVKLHTRSCPEAIRTASEAGNTIVAVDDFHADDSILYPVRLLITGVDRFHLLRDIIDSIVETAHLSMTRIETTTDDEIVTCSLDFDVHSARELDAVTDRIRRINGIDDVSVMKR